MLACACTCDTQTIFVRSYERTLCYLWCPKYTTQGIRVPIAHYTARKKNVGGQVYESRISSPDIASPRIASYGKRRDVIRASVRRRPSQRDREKGGTSYQRAFCVLSAAFRLVSLLGRGSRISGLGILGLEARPIGRVRDRSDAVRARARTRARASGKKEEKVLVCPPVSRPIKRPTQPSPVQPSLASAS